MTVDIYARLLAFAYMKSCPLYSTISSVETKIMTSDSTPNRRPTDPTISRARGRQFVNWLSSQVRKSATMARNWLLSLGRSLRLAVRWLTKGPVGKTAVWLLIALSVAFATAGAALILRYADPRTQIIVSAFQVYGLEADTNSQSGKALSDLVVDSLNDITEEADNFAGDDYSSRTAYNAVRDLPKIPVNTSYGIEFNGISLDQLFATWDHIRFREYLISADLLVGPEGSRVIKLRYATQGRAQSYSVTVSYPGGPKEIEQAISSLALTLMKEISPETAVRKWLEVLIKCTDDCETKTNKVVQLCLDWVEKEPRSPLAAYYLGYALTFTKHLEDALPFLNKAFALKLSRYYAASAKNLEGYIMQDKQLYPEAETYYKESIDMRYVATPMNNFGLSAMEIGNYSESELYLRKAVEIDPNYYGAWFNLGITYLHEAKDADAVEALKQAAQLKPRDFEVLTWLVRALVRNGKSQDAFSDCDIAGRLSPNNSEVRFLKGVVYLDTRQPDQAIEELMSYRGNRFVRYLLGEAYMMKGDFPEARHIFEEVLARSPKDAEGHHLLAKVLDAQGMHEESVSEEEEAERDNPFLRYYYFNDTDLTDHY